MSFYHQSTQAFGALPYHSPTYTQPTPTLPPTGGYHYPQPIYHPDPSSFRRDYASRLSELTVNSRPIIQNLSMIAQDFTRFADIVADCLEAHIRRVPPWMKLPAFYLLDAISKNVYDPYATKFSTFVVPLFLETYHQVDSSTRSKMDEMLVTWRTGAPNGKELFGVAPQVKIERTIWGNQSASMVDNNQNSRRQPAGGITKSQVLAELEVTLAQKERLVQINPYDSASKNHVGVLHQLRKLVEAGVSQDELSQILNQLRALARENATAPPPQAAPLVTAPTFSVALAPQSPLPTQLQAPQYNSQQNMHHYPQNPQSQTHVLPEAMSVAQISTSITSPAAAPVLSNISDLFNSLLKAGLVSTSSSSSTPLGAGTSTQQAEDAKTEDDNSSIEAAQDYAKSVLSMKIKLTTSDITRLRPQNTSFLYERLPIQCKQCAIRFPDDHTGKKKMEHHLDMHFRQNRKASQNVGRGHSRSWFVGAESWAHDIDNDMKGKGRADTSRLSNKAAAAAAEAADREAILRASFVVVPPGDEAKNILCPVCKETLKSEFMEEDEEWVWRNAVRVKDKIFHATCNAEMTTSGSLAARLRADSALDGSRSGTPERMIHSPPSPVKGKLRVSKSPTPDSALTGTKRKAQDDFPQFTYDQGDRTPPMKKLAVGGL